VDYEPQCAEYEPLWKVPRKMLGNKML
jgi:hypothetical protein